MKNAFFVIFFFISLHGFAKTETDTITTWQLYKDNSLIFKSNPFDEIFTVNIKTNDNYKNLTLNILSDIRSQNVRRKLLFKINGKLVFTYIRQLKSNNDSIVIPNAELRRIIGTKINEIFTVEYTDNTESEGTALFKLVLSGK